MKNKTILEIILYIFIIATTANCGLTYAELNHPSHVIIKHHSPIAEGKILKKLPKLTFDHREYISDFDLTFQTNKKNVLMLATAPEADRDGVLDSIDHDVLGGIVKNYNLFYRRINSYTQIPELFNQLSKKHGKFEVMIIAAHGDFYNLVFPDDALFSSDLKSAIGEKIDMSGFDKNPYVFLYACSTGAMVNNRSFVDHLSEALPNVTIAGSSEPIMMDHFFSTDITVDTEYPLRFNVIQTGKSVLVTKKFVPGSNVNREPKELYIQTMRNYPIWINGVEFHHDEYLSPSAYFDPVLDQWSQENIDFWKRVQYMKENDQYYNPYIKQLINNITEKNGRVLLENPTIKMLEALNVYQQQLQWLIPEIRALLISFHQLWGGYRKEVSSALNYLITTDPTSQSAKSSFENINVIFHSIHL